MRTFKYLVLFSLLIIGVFVSCQKEFSSDAFIPTTSGSTPNITATVQGRVVDELGKPVAGAEIRTTTLSVFTDVNGEFRMVNAALYDKASFVTVIKPGYFTGSRTFMSRPGEKHYMEVKLLPKIIAGTVNSTSGGSVNIANGAQVTLPASGVVGKQSKAAYNGQVNVSIAWIDPTSADLEREMPGALRGYDNSNNEVGLKSYGMLAVELEGGGGEPLQMAPGKVAGLKFPIPASIIGRAPATIPLWSFNESTGLWKQEGTATKRGNFYEGEVSHFSFWNCDAPVPVIDFKATVTEVGGSPLRHVLVRITRLTDGTSTSCYTDSSGVVLGKVPSNENLKLDVVNTCNSAVFTQNIGPFTSAANITVSATNSSPQQAIITGNVQTCTGGVVTSGSAEMVINQRVYRSKLVSGTFSFSIPVCSPGQSAMIVAVDSANNQQGSVSVTVKPGSVNAGTVSACGVSTSQFINFSVSGTPYVLTAPGDSMVAIKQGNISVVQGFRINNSNTGGYIGLDFRFDGSTTGSHPLLDVNPSVPVPAMDSTAIFQLPATINITEFGTIGNYIAGSFNANIIKTGNGATTYPVQCSFRVKRVN